MGRGTAAQAELQVLFLREGVGYLLGRADGEGEEVPTLSHYDGGPDVDRVDLNVLSGRLTPNGQAVSPPSLAAVGRSIVKGGRDVVYLRLVDPLVDALLKVLEDDGDLEPTKGEEGYECSCGF